MSISLADLEEGLFYYLSRHVKSFPSRWKRWLAMFYPDARIRKLFWQETFVEMGEGTYANLGMIVGDDYTTGECLLSFGDRVSIAPGVIFIPYSYPNNSPLMQAHGYISSRLIIRKKIVVEDDVWIGAHVTILPGVHIGRGAIVGAGAVVREDVPPFTIVAGVPAKVIRLLDPLPDPPDSNYSGSSQ